MYHLDTGNHQLFRVEGFSRLGSPITNELAGLVLLHNLGADLIHLAIVALANSPSYPSYSHSPSYLANCLVTLGIAPSLALHLYTFAR